MNIDTIIQDQKLEFKKIGILSLVIQKDDNSFTLSCKVPNGMDIKSFREQLRNHRIFKYHSIDTGLRFPNTQGDYTHSIKYRLQSYENEDTAEINEFFKTFKI